MHLAYYCYYYYYYYIKLFDMFDIWSDGPGISGFKCGWGNFAG